MDFVLAFLLMVFASDGLAPAPLLVDQYDDETQCELMRALIEKHEGVASVSCVPVMVVRQP